MIICIPKRHPIVCLEVPQVLPRFRKPDPDPGPWIRHERITKEIAHDLSVLATIQDLSTQLSARLQPAFTESLLQSVKALNLSDAMDVSLNAKVQVQDAA